MDTQLRISHYVYSIVPTTDKSLMVRNAYYKALARSEQLVEKMSSSRGTYGYVLTKRLKSLLERFGYALTCERCGKHFKVGDPLVRKKRGRAYRTKKHGKRGSNKYYCKRCWESLFIDC